jgi:hypothetical protein
MRMWPISTRVNKPENDDPTIIELIKLATDAAVARQTPDLLGRAERSSPKPHGGAPKARA